MSRLRRRYRRRGHARDARKPWSMLHRGEHMGFIHAHDRDEALAIAHDAAPPMWRKGDIDVRAASFGHAAYGMRSMLLEARGQGASRADVGTATAMVFRPASGDKWEAAGIEYRGGMWHMGAWRRAPFGSELLHATATIDQAIRGAA